MRHFGELIRDLTHNLDSDPPLHSPAEAVDATKDGVTGVNPADIPAQIPERIALSRYGDEASLHAVRVKGLEVFETRALTPEAVVALWIDVVPVWVCPLVLCVAVTVEGYRRVLDFVEAFTGS